MAAYPLCPPYPIVPSEMYATEHDPSAMLRQSQKDMRSLIMNLESEDLRQFLTEAALCVVQSGNESAKVTMLEARLKDDNNPVVELLQRARQEIPVENLKQENSDLAPLGRNPYKRKKCTIKLHNFYWLSSLNKGLLV